MPSYSEALEQVLKNIQVLDIEEKPLFKCTGQVLAEDIFSDFSLPLRDQSGPDGYAVISDDIKTAGKDTPIALQIVDTVRAGYLPKTNVKHGTAIRIMTGSVLPEGADCVIRFEDTDEPDNKSGPNKNNPSIVKIYLSVTAGTNVTKAGANVLKGSLILSKGDLIGPSQLSVLTTLGKAEVKVIRRPVIGVISTGDELINLGKPLLPSKSYNGNSAALAALISHYGGIPRIIGIARDNEKSVVTNIRKGLKMDAIITSGGVAKGDFDLVRSVITRIGELVFYRISMGPGASVAFGLIKKQPENQLQGSIPIFALAGPPSGCLINFETIVRAALLKMMGKEKIAHPIISAVSLNSTHGKRPMAFVRWSRLEKIDGEYRVEINRAEKVGVLAAIATANSLTITPEGTELNQGQSIPVLPLDWCVDF